MGHVFFDHTGDVGVRLEGGSLDELFHEAALAFAETLTDRAAVARRTTQCVVLAAGGLEDLLVDWLDELVYQFEVRNLLIADASVRLREQPPGWSLEGKLVGETFDPSRHVIKVLIKGITYHQLAVRREGDRWATSVIFDI